MAETKVDNINLDRADADVELVAGAIAGEIERLFGQSPDHAGRQLIDAYARAALSALSGRLLPPGGETYTSWAVRDERGVVRRWTETEARRVAAEHGGTLLCGTHTTWPDGTMLIGAWQPAPTGSETDR